MICFEMNIKVHLAVCILLALAAQVYSQSSGELQCDSLLVDSLGSKLEVEYTSGNLTGALNVIEDILSLTDLCYGSPSAELAEQYHNKGLILLDLRRYEESREAYVQAVDLAREVYQPNDSIYMWYLKDYAYVLRRCGRYKEALPVHLEIYEHTLEFDSDSPKLLATWSNTLGLVYKKLSQLENAEKLYLNALDITAESVGRDDPAYAIYQNNLAGLYRSRGRYEEALVLYNSALENAKINFGTESKKYSLRQRNLASLLRSMGRYEKALPLYLENVKLSKQLDGEVSRGYNRALDGLGLLYIRMGQYAQAIEVLTQALEIGDKTFGKNHPEFAQCINNLALAHKLSENYKEAEKFYLEGIRISEENGEEEGIDYSILLDNLGQVYFKMEKYDEAIDLAERALEISRKLRGDKNTGYAIQINNLALSLSETGKYEEAFRLFDEALRIQKELFGEQHPEIAVRLNNFYPAMGESQRLNYLAKLDTYTGTIYSFGPDLPGNPEITRSIQELSIASKGLALERSISSRIEALSNRDDVLAGLQSQWADTRTVLYKTYTMRNDQRDDLNLNIDSLRNLVSDLEGKMSRMSGIQVSSERIDWEKWKSEIPEETAVIDFYTYEIKEGFRKTGRIGYAALINKRSSGHPVLIPLISDEELRPYLTQNPNNSDSYLHKTGAKALSKLLLEPLWDELEGIKDLHLIPAGNLHRISFEALPIPGDGLDVLIDAFRIFYHSNPRNIHYDEEIQPTQDVLLVGGAVFDLDSTELELIKLQNEVEEDADMLLAYADRSVKLDSLRSGRYFPYLPGTRSEVESISDLLTDGKNQVHLITGSNALEDVVKDFTGDNAPGIIHLATHGYFFEPIDSKLKGFDVRSKLLLAENPLLRSGLVFSGVHHVWQGGDPLEGMDDGILTAYEIASLDLRKTKLVVLSACETGRGSIHQAEGVMGLQRAFKTAGADKLVLSLWKVPDKETAQLMRLMYSFYLEDGNISQALRRAKLSMRKQYDPFYWAGFVMVE